MEQEGEGGAVLDAALLRAEIEGMLMIRPVSPDPLLVDNEIEGLKMLLELCQKTSP